jgi:hypothetical protein
MRENSCRTGRDIFYRLAAVSTTFCGLNGR